MEELFELVGCAICAIALAIYLVYGNNKNKKGGGAWD